MPKLLPLIASVLMLAASLVLAQDPSELGSRFARASITKNEKPLLMGTIFEDTVDNLIVLGAPLSAVIARAYDVQPHQVVDAPEWVYQDHLYDIEAVPPPAALIEADETQMLQSLLSDRFGLRVYRGTRPVTQWVLAADLAAQRGLALRALPGEVVRYASRRPASVAVGGPRARYVSLRLPVLPSAGGGTVMTTRALIGALASILREPVFDLTGSSMVHLHDALAVRTLAVDPALVTDVLKHSGLTLERRTVPTNVLVVTRVEHPTLDPVDR